MIELIEWEGLRLAIRGGSVDREQIDWMSNSPFWTEFVRAPILPGSTVLDLGSHIGSFALRVSSQRRCNVWASEPDHESAALHRINSAINGLDALQTIYPGAVGEETGVAELHEAAANWGHTTTGASSEWNQLTGRQRQVECLSLEGVFQQAKVSRCPFMKINIEGAEFGFFRGANIRDLRRVDHLVCELHFDLAPEESAEPVLEKLRRADLAVNVLPDKNTDLRGWLVASR